MFTTITLIVAKAILVIAALCVFFLVLFTIAACIRSAQISREEEKVCERVWIG